MTDASDDPPVGSPEPDREAVADRGRGSPASAARVPEARQLTRLLDRLQAAARRLGVPGHRSFADRQDRSAEGAVIPAVRPREARPFLVAALLAALAGATLGAAQTWPMLDGGGVRLDALAASEAPAVHEHLPLAQFLRWRRRLRPTDRWWLDVPKGASAGMTYRGEVYRTFAFYWFLPALPASSPGAATVVFRLSAAR